jgi:HEAT repeats
MSRSMLLRLSLPLVALLMTGSAVAQADEHFRQAVEAYRAGDSAGAIEHLKAVLAENPSNEQALALWSTAEQDVITQMLMERGELGLLADRFLRLAKAGHEQITEDPGSAAEVVARLLGGDPLERDQAMLELRANFGPWAVPALLPALGDRSNTDHRVSAIQALVRLGPDAVMPLIAVLGSDDIMTRRNAAAVLGTIGDTRAAAGLAFMARDDEDETTRAVAADALNKLGVGSKDPVLLARGLAEGWFRGDDMLVQPWNSPAVVWEMKEGTVQGRRVLAGLYHLELAEQNARAALDHGAGDAIRPLLAAVHAAMKAEILAAANLADMQGNELLASAQERLPGLDKNLALAGSQRGKALILCIASKRRQPLAAQALMESMGASGEERQALKAALSDSDPGVAIGAALALARQGDTDNAVVARLASALTSAPERLVVAIGDTGLVGAAPGWTLVPSDDEVDGLLRAKALPPKDVVVVQDGMEGVTLDTLVFALKNDPRTAQVPLVVVSKDVDGVQALYGDKIAKVVGSASFADVSEVAGERDMQQAALVDRARACADALAAMPAGVVRAAADQLGEALAGTSDDAVRAALVRLAGHAAIESALPAVETIVLDDTASPELRREAVIAAAKLWAVHGGSTQAPDRLAEVLSAMVQSGDEALALPAAQALGQLRGAPDAALSSAAQ